MKKIFVLSAFSIVVVLLNQCSKDKAAAPNPCELNNVITYTNDIKPLLDANCATSGCHDAVTHQSGYDYSNYASAAEWMDPAICKINATCGSLMPPTGKMADSLICRIEKWKEQNYPN